MTRQNGNLYDEEYLRQGSPTNTTYRISAITKTSHRSHKRVS